MRAIAKVAHRASMVVVSTLGNLNIVDTPAGSFDVASTGNSNAADIPAGNLVAVSTAGNLNAVSTPVGSLVAADIVARSTVAVDMVNVAAMASIATERERQRYRCQVTLRQPCRRAI